MPEHAPKTSDLLLGRPHPFAMPEGLVDLQRQGPIHRVTLTGGEEGWLVTQHAYVRRLLADERLHNSPGSARVAVRGVPAGIREGNLARLDPPEHTRYRRALTSFFTLRRARAMQPVIERIVEERIAAMRKLPRPVDLVMEFSIPMPRLVIFELFGMPEEGLDEFMRRVVTINTPGASEEEINEARQGNIRYYRELIAQLRDEPRREGLLSHLVHSCDDEGVPFTNHEVLGMILFIATAAHEMTMQTISLGLFALLLDPELPARLRAHPEEMPAAVEELLRYLTVIQFGLFRIAREDMTIAGTRVAAGEPVLLSLFGANRDPRHFSRPDELDLARPPSQHVAFGHGIHQCLGQHLARVEVGAAIKGLLTGLPGLRLAVPPEEVVMRRDLPVYGVDRMPVTWDEED